MDFERPCAAGVAPGSHGIDDLQAVFSNSAFFPDGGRARMSHAVALRRRGSGQHRMAASRPYNILPRC